MCTQCSHKFLLSLELKSIKHRDLLKWGKEEKRAGWPLSVVINCFCLKRVVFFINLWTRLTIAMMSSYVRCEYPINGRLQLTIKINHVIANSLISLDKHAKNYKRAV